MADLVRRKVAVIATPGSNPASVVAKAATSTIPIVFGVSDDPVKLGLVASIARPGGNATGINWLLSEVTTKRLGLLHEMVPRVVRLAVLVNPGNASTAEATLNDVSEAGRSRGLQIQVYNAGNSREIQAVFTALAREPKDALFVGPDGFFNSRRVQFAVLAARQGIPASYAGREHVEAGGLMSYGTSAEDMFRRAGIYVGQILKGANPAELPVIQSTKFALTINLQTASALGLDANTPRPRRRADRIGRYLLRCTKSGFVQVFGCRQ